jgi:hypothetical protein
MIKPEITYKSLKIQMWDKIYCSNIDEHVDSWEQHLTIGKSYIIEDLEFRFPNSICVESDNGKISMYMPAKFFSEDIKSVRKKKIGKINNQLT